jgi:ribosomal protein S12 methylthiotransferase accessory factor
MAFLSPSTAKTFWRGTHRTRSPVETVKLARAVASRVGVTRVADVTGLDRIGIPVVSVIRPNARSISVSQGKGLDVESAKASGLMEAIEGYHAESVSRPLRHETVREMSATSTPVVDVARLARSGRNQLDLDRKILWIEGKTLLEEQLVWLPYETVHTDFTDDTLVREPTFFMSSNGLASGNHHAEAWNHALYEVIERDAATLWDLSRAMPFDDSLRVDLTSIDDEDCRQVLAHYARAGMRLIVRDITSDVQVPCFRCTIGEEAGVSLHPRAPTSGYGCHADRSVALLRALLEAAQSRLTVIAGAREDIPQRAYDARAIHDASVTFLEQARKPGERAFGDTVDHAGDTFAGDLRWLSERLAAVGCTQIVGIDLTKPEFDVPVVRVVVPGLEAMCSVPDYVPGPRALKVLAARARQEIE